MKTLKFFLFALLVLNMCMAYAENPDERDLLKSKLTGEWVVVNQKDSYIYAFADDMIYVKTQEGDTIDQWTYLPVADDSIRIVRNWITNNKVIFYSGDSIRINDFLPVSGSTGEQVPGLQDAASCGAALQQNSPNPFNQSTVIRYTLPQTGKSAKIVISNTAGRIVRQIPLQSGGTGSITVEGGTFPAGVYYYSLYMDNHPVDTKKMILTKAGKE
jgi:hypothetical protein